ncbi:hypothetical protein M378DRAFT_14734 [Amanita muscaria Koide BX008]|uniref:Uncharacterized protein n=1 Tax=Amanita muscaria (strain Koide BX008) TaxID=946122 RepID=A0A0C2WTF6_AMAMK|nr:hypothetical protein M378DRAFT_14734 [Amanita muscaria Koide BX008]
MSQTSNIISPCSRLNDDILREIFIHCIIIHTRSYTDPYCKAISICFAVASYYELSIRNPPQLSVSQVCSSWRDIALLTPQLWDNICIRDLTEDKLSIAREYLSRAKKLPVSITIEQWTPGQPRQDWRSQLTDFLSSYRIRTLILDVPEKLPQFQFHQILPDLPQQSVAQLESLFMNSHRDQEEAQIDFNDARYPKLAVVRIRGAYKISNFNSLSSSLRIFDHTRLPMTVIESWDLLSHCPSLEEAWLWITQVNSSRGPVSMPQIHLPHLRMLVLLPKSRREETPFSTFIEVLSLPALASGKTLR